MYWFSIFHCILYEINVKKKQSNAIEENYLSDQQLIFCTNNGNGDFLRIFFFQFFYFMFFKMEIFFSSYFGAHQHWVHLSARIYHGWTSKKERISTVIGENGKLYFVKNIKSLRVPLLSGILTWFLGWFTIFSH